MLVMLLFAHALRTIPSPLAHASGTTIAVTTFDDELNNDGDCSLREAVQAANTDQAVDACPSGNGADTITLQTGTYTLSMADQFENANASGDIDILDTLTINGAGASRTIIDGNHLDRILDIIPEIKYGFHVTLMGVTLRNGKTPAYGMDIELVGAAIRTITNLTLSDVIISNNTSTGGSIFNGGTLVVEDSIIRANSGVYGAGIFSFEDTAVTITNSMIADNNAHPYANLPPDSFGGGIAALGYLEITDSIISGNVVDADGGAISIYGTLIMDNTIVRNNVAGGSAGGIYCEGEATISKSIISNNQTSGLDGGGIINMGTLTLENTDVVSNTAVGSAGGIANLGVATIKQSSINANQSLDSKLGGGGIVSTGSLLLQESEVSHNIAGAQTQEEDKKADASGGGLINEGTATIQRTTFEGNQANNGIAGAIANAEIMQISESTIAANTAENTGGILNFAQGKLTIQDSEIVSNTANFLGGGIANNGTLTLRHSRILSNAVTAQRGVSAHGGGIFNLGGMLNISNNTLVSYNTSASNGGGIYNTITGTLTLSSTTIRQNRAEFFGGGIANDGTLRMNASHITLNDAIMGAGLVNGHDDNRTSRAFIEQSEISNNISLREGIFSEDDEGSEIYLVGSCGGIYNFATLQIASSTIQQNTALGIGGICNDAVLTITESRISDNEARRTIAGGIGNTGVLEVDACVIASNHAQTYGGGIFNARLGYLGDVGKATISSTTIQSNTAQTQAGGGIHNEGAMLVSESSLLYNRAFMGGGLNTKGEATLTNVTVSSNTSFMPAVNRLNQGNSGTPVGGGLSVDVSGILTITNVTVSHNTIEASGMGGGIFNNSMATVKNSIIANNTAGGDCGGTTINSQGNNLTSDASCRFSTATDLNQTNPLLHLPTDNGGTTWTSALQQASPAIDAGDNAQCPTTDQRGMERPFDGNGDGDWICDIGAYESHEGTPGERPEDIQGLLLYLPRIQVNH
jgi:CSLREA domain-containing protein